MSRRTLLSSLLALMGCARHPLPPELMTAEAVRSWVLERVPAWRTRRGRGDDTAWRGIDYVYCDLRQPMGVLQTRRWQLALVERDGKLVDVGVSTSQIGA